jgi:predicted nicotinamide N-methyase
MGLTGTVAAAMGADVTFADLEAPALLFARLNSLPFDPTGRRTRTHRLNWQTDRLGRRFDLIIGADILYERAQWDFLEPFWRAHLARDGSVLLGEPGRPTGEMFGEWITARGWQIEEFAEPVTTRPSPIRIFRIRIAPLT